MIEIRRITEYEELDAILPLIHRLHEMYDVPTPISAFIGYIAMQLKNPYQGIWVGYDSGRPVGYALASIEANYFALQCVVIDAYMEKIDEKASGEVWNLINLWAKENNCKQIACYTYRDPDAVATKYGFVKRQSYLTKEI